jgi:NAD(P)-dependent dehydrogenase (short-subunit alcohol dehydrogenase family)
MTDYLKSLFNLEGKVAAVTGGGGHLCGEMARSLARAGVAVGVMDMRMEKAEAVRAEITGAGGKAMALEIDVVDKDGLQSCLDSLVDAFGGVDILINGAGHNAPTPFMEIPLDEWRSIIDSHVTGTMLACQVFGAHMLERGHGSIINMSSASAGPPLSKAFTYSVAKAGIKNLTQNLAREWAPMNVRVNALRPGFFPTEWSMKHFIDPDRQNAILGHTAMGRYGKPEELTGAVLWLASDAAGFVTGAEIAIDGGFSCMTI